MYKLTENEVRNGLIELLKSFDSFCNEHGIKYCLAYGTLLGAIRHKGFIPWDNDVDIFITKSEADKLIKACEEEKPTQWGVKTRHHYSPNVHSRVYFYDKSTTGDATENSLGLCIDGFILNNYPPTSWLRAKATILEAMLIAKTVPEKNLKSYNIVKRYIILGLRKLTAKQTLNDIGNKYNEALSDGNGKPSNSVFIMRTPYGVKKYPKSIFQDFVYMDYETVKLPCPKGYDEFLTMTYGEYMTPPPEEKRTKVVSNVWRFD